MARRGHTNIDSMQDESPLGLQANFIEGLKTEHTGLNFPPNAATDTDNCVFTMLGDVTRRKGFDFELNYHLDSLGDRTDAALNTYVWRNAGGDGESEVFVVQVGSNLDFYVITDSRISSPLSNHKLSSTVDLTQYVVSGSPRAFECQFADGNGYLFIYNNACNPVYCTYDPIAETVTSNVITIKTRDFIGATSEAPDNPTTRLQTLTPEHEYNLRNQGWTRAPLWTVTAQDALISFQMGDGSETIPQSFTGNGYVGIGIAIGDHPFTFPTGEPISVGTPVDIQYTVPCWIYDIEAIQWTTGNATGKAIGVIKSYDGTTGAAVLGVTYTEPVLHADNLEFGANPGGGGILGPVQYTLNSSKSINTIDTFFAQIGLYPSNADIWWIFKNEKDEFSPATTIGNKGLPTAWAPKGHFVLDAFNQDRTAVTNEANSFASQVAGLQTIITSKRPTNGTWFQGRVWYAGVDDSQQAAGDQSFFTWTENIYFSRIVESIGDFGRCHEDNDPTDQYSFNLLPSDGGVITIQGAGAIFRLFPIQNGMLVFAANGVWFITGSQGIGFSANDYTITKISGVRSISSNSYVDVNGLPMFWNEEGIYTVAPAQQGLGLTVNPMTVGTIKSFYDKIPLSTKKAARGSYNPVDYIVQWLYNGTATLAAAENSAGTILPAFRMWLFDESCHQWTTDDQGVTWVHRTTPADTLDDGWSDQSVAYIDGDYDTTVAVNETGKLGFSFDTGRNWTMTGFVPTGFPFNLATNAHATKVLMTVTDDYLYITTDHGLTYTAVGTNLGVRKWAACCFNAGATVMYATSKDNYISKSADGGATWFDLTSGPHETHTAFNGVGIERIRCSGDGNTVIYNNGYTGNVFVSRDGGVTWTTVYAAGAGSSGSTASDCGVSYDGSTMILSSNLTSVVKISKDFGATWTDHSPLSPPRTANVSQAGNAFVIGYDTVDDPNSRHVEFSVDGGTTWNVTTTGLPTFQWVNSYIYDKNFVPGGSASSSSAANSPFYFSRILNYNTFTNAFYPWSISTNDLNGTPVPIVHSVDYVAGPGGADTPKGIFKYFSSVLSGGVYSYTFSEVTDPTYVDWDYATETTGDVYNSYFVTGYSLFGQGLRKFQPLYLEMFSRLNETNMKYSVEGLWDFATSGNSGKWSTRQVVSLDKPNFGMAFKRHKIRGNGYALQLKISSVNNSPFDIMGWNMQVTQNAGM